MMIFSKNSKRKVYYLINIIDFVFKKLNKKSKHKLLKIGMFRNTIKLKIKILVYGMINGKKNL